MPAFLDAARALHASGWKRVASLIVRGLLVLRPRHLAALQLRCAWALEAGDHAAAERLCRRMTEVAPQEPGPLWDLAQLELLRGAIHDAVAHFQRHAELVAGPSYATRALRSSHLDLELARSGRPYFRRLAGVLVDTGYWTIIDGDVIYSDDTHGRSLPGNPMVRGRVSPDGGTVIASYPAPRSTIERECIFVGGDENYSHWVFRNLLKLSTLDREGLLHAYPWLINADLRGYQREYLRLLGVAEAALVPVARNDIVRCDRLIVPALLTSQRTIRKGAEWIRERLGGCMAGPGRAARRIYVSRRDVNRRTLLNEEELVEALAPLGFEVVVPGELSVTDQIRAFSEARLIVGPTGAAWTNMLFAPWDAALVIITSSVLERGDIFRRIAGSMGLRLETIVSDRYLERPDPYNANADYFVDTGAVVRAARQLLE
jgi:capsular polysaccharide biosynthesis protein